MHIFLEYIDVVIIIIIIVVDGLADSHQQDNHQRGQPLGQTISSAFSPENHKVKPFLIFTGQP